MQSRRALFTDADVKNGLAGITANVRELSLLNIRQSLQTLLRFFPRSAARIAFFDSKRLSRLWQRDGTQTVKVYDANSRRSLSVRCIESR